MVNGIAFVGAALAANLTLAQALPPDEPIIVEGQKLPTIEQALKTVTDITATVESQLARYTGAVCPKVAGVVPEQAAQLEERMRATAKQVGAAVAGANCEPNLLLAVVPDGSKFVSELRTKRPQWFNGVSNSEVDRILGERRVRSWSVTSLRNEDGQMLGDAGSTLQGTSQYERQGNQNLAAMRQVEVWSPSIFRKMTRYVIEGSVVVIDADATKPLTIRQIADYAVFRGLARIRTPRNAADLDSILSVFDVAEAAAPRELTRFDRAYLGEMYRNIGQKGFEPAVHERYRIAAAVAGGQSE